MSEPDRGKGVGIISVTYNSARVVDELMAMVHHEPPRGVDWVIVDNGSTDGTWERLQQARCTVVQTGRNLGFGRAVNLGLTHLVEEDLAWIGVLNPDVTIDIGELVDSLATVEASSIGGYAPALVSDPATGTFEVDVFRPRPSLRSALGVYVLPFLRAKMPRSRSEVQGLHPTAVTSGAALFLRPQAWRDTGGFDEGFFLFGEDVDLCVRVQDAGWRLVVDTDMVGIHARGGSSPVPRWSRKLEVARADARLFSKVLPTWQAVVARGAIMAGMLVRALHMVWRELSVDPLCDWGRLVWLVGGADDDQADPQFV